MSEVVLTTYGWVPELPRGLVRDLRVRWAPWVIAALNSVDLPCQPWALFRFMGFPGEAPEAKFVEEFLKARLDRMEVALAGREWLVRNRFSVADLLMADVLRQVDRFDGLASHPNCRAFVARATARPAFAKAYDDQLAHFAAADPA